MQKKKCLAQSTKFSLPEIYFFSHFFAFAGTFDTSFFIMMRIKPRRKSCGNSNQLQFLSEIKRKNCAEKEIKFSWLKNFLKSKKKSVKKLEIFSELFQRISKIKFRVNLKLFFYNDNVCTKIPLSVWNFPDNENCWRKTLFFWNDFKIFVVSPQFASGSVRSCCWYCNVLQLNGALRNLCHRWSFKIPLFSHIITEALIFLRIEIFMLIRWV